LLIFVDLFPSDELIPVKQVQLLKNELAAYKDDLTQKISWVVCNKIDLLKSENISEISKSFQKELKTSEKDIYFISAATGEGTQELLNALEEEISKNKLGLT
jgi:GTP-binding protein